MTQRRTRLSDPPKPDRPRSGIPPGRRLALGVAACLGLVVLPAAGAVADDSAPIVSATVYKAGGGTTTDTVTPDALHASSSQCPTYGPNEMDQYGRQGLVAQPLAAGNTWTLPTILACMQTPIPLSAVTGITVIGDNGAPLTGHGSQLYPPDLKDGQSDFEKPSETPVIVDSGTVDDYYRPWRGGSDLNFLDHTQTTPIAIEVFQGPPLQVTALPRQQTIDVNGSVNFSATVSGNNGSPLTYSWSFGGGASDSNQAAPSIRFSTSGVWTVNVEVTDADGGGGGDQVTVTVNQPGSTTTPATTGTRTTGPTKSSGPTPGGPATKQKQSGTHPNGSGHGHGNNNTHTTSTPTQTTTTQTTTNQTTTTPAAGASGGSAGSSGSSGGASTPTTPGQTTTGHPAPPAPTHRATPKPPRTGTLVHGQLVSDVVPLPASQSPLVHLLPASVGGAPAREAPESPSPLPIVAAALAVLVLLGLGAQRELGRPRWWPAALRIGH